MKKFILIALTCAVSLSAYPSEKGGNTFGSYELQIALDDFSESVSCPGPYVLEVPIQQICGELGEKVLLGGSTTAKQFYRQCCRT